MPQRFANDFMARVYNREALRAVNELLLRLGVAWVDRNDLLELGASFVVHAEHHLGHGEVVQHFKVARYFSGESGKGIQRSVEVSFKALNQRDLVSSVHMPRIHRKNARQFDPRFCVATVAPSLEASLVDCLDIHSAFKNSFF